MSDSETQLETSKMMIDYDSHPTDLGVEGGYVNSNIGVQELRRAIPPHCFKPSYAKSLYYLFENLFFAGAAAWIAYQFIPIIDDTGLRWSAWALYGWVQGLLFCGLWILGHECGHGAFSLSTILNDTVGFGLHSFLLTPYFSWKSTHRRHHIYANHITKDLHYVPPLKRSYLDSLRRKFNDLDELTEDAPFFTLFRIIVQQVTGFPLYLLTNITAAPNSLHKEPSKFILGNSHFAPAGPLFLSQETCRIIASDLGVLSAALILYWIGTQVGQVTLMLLYVQAYFWSNHWIVAITYLHHTHPNVPKFEPESWTFVKGATATVDREFGFIGKHIFHGIIEFHVIHHLFSRIPFYHAEEATNAIIPLLGDSYHSDKNRRFLSGLWEAFTKCQWVEPNDKNARPQNRELWYRPGPSPPPEYKMGQLVGVKKL